MRAQHTQRAAVAGRDWAWLMQRFAHPTREKTMRTIFCSLLLALPLASVGCASNPPPTDHLASAIAAVSAARAAGADQVPQASLQLKLAEEQVSQAREMVKRGQHERADYMTLRAFNDAELATALAREQQAKAAEAAAVQGAEATPAVQ
jgi:hypothetical protein